MASELHEIPGVGRVLATIDVQSFFQAGEELRTLDSVTRVDGSSLSATELSEARRVLVERGVIRY